MNGNDQILGIDICNGLMRVAQLGRREDGYVLSRCAQVPVSAESDAADVAEILKELLAQNDFTTTQAVFSLASDESFLRYVREDEFEASHEKHQIVDSWQCSGDMRVVGVGRKTAVNRINVIAARAGLSVEAIGMRPMACMGAMGLIGGYASKVTLAIAVDDICVTMGIFDGQAIRLLQSRELESNENHEVLRTIRQLWRLVQLASDQIRPSRVKILWDACEDEDIQAISAELEIEDIQTLGHAWKPADGQTDLFDLRGRYIAAVGLAMQGLNLATGKAVELPRPMNFSIRLARKRSSLKLTRKNLTIAIVIAVIILIGFICSSLIGRQVTLSRLKKKYAKLEPIISQQEQQRNLWQAVRPWVAISSNGTRPAYRPVLDAVSELLPAADQAYVNRMEIHIDPETKTQVVRLDGRSSGTEVLYEFVSRLNNSKIFDKAKLGTVTDLPDTTTSYGKKWSVTFSVLADSVSKETARKDKENSAKKAKEKGARQ